MCRFSEVTPCDPRSPYSSSNVVSDHLVNAWHHIYRLPVLFTNCCNNFGSLQFHENLIPMMILKGLSDELIPPYGDGAGVRV